MKKLMISSAITLALYSNASIAEDTLNYASDSNCTPKTAEEVTQMEKEKGYSYACRTMLIVLDGPNKRYNPLLSAPNNRAAVCGWRLLTETPGSGSSISVDAAYQNNDFQAHGTAATQGAKLFARIQVRWLQIPAENTQISADEICYNDGFRKAGQTPLRPRQNGSGCRWVSDGQHPPFLECA